MTVYLFLGILAAFMIGGLFNPVWGVMGYLVVYTLYSPHVWWGAILVNWLPRPSLLAASFLALGCLLNLNKLDFSFSRRELEIVLFLATAWIVSLVSGFGLDETSWQYLDKLTKSFIFIVILIRVIHDLPSYRKVIWLLAIAGLFMAYQAHGVGRFYDGRLDSIGGIDFSEANAFAGFLLFCIAILGFKLFRAPIWGKAILVLAIALMTNALIMTQSRAAFLGAVLAVPFALIRVPKGYRKQVWVYGAFAVVLFFTLADRGFMERIETIGKEAKSYEASNPMADQDALSRFDFWRASLKILADHPMGIGVKNFEEVVPLYDPRNPGLDAHNSYVLCYTELGAVGLILFLVIVAEAWMQLSRVRRLAETLEDGREITFHAMTLQVVWIVYMLGMSMTHSYLYSQMTWLLLALPICLERAALKLAQEEAASIPGEETELGAREKNEEKMAYGHADG